MRWLGDASLRYRKESQARGDRNREMRVHTLKDDTIGVEASSLLAKSNALTLVNVDLSNHNLPGA